LEAVPEVNTVLTLCGFARLVDGKDLDVLDLFGDFTDSLIDNMVDHNEKHTPAAQHVRFGVQRILCSKVVAHWVHQKHREGVIPNIDDLDIDILRENIHEMTIKSAADTNCDDKMFYLDKFNPKKYVLWACSFENYLDSDRGNTSKGSIIICDLSGRYESNAVDEYQHILWQTPHIGILAYNEDNHKVYCIYKDLMFATEGWTWFNRAPNGNGRAAYLLIKHHYRGDTETAVHAAEAAWLHHLHCHNESALPFKQYVTKLSELKCFELMADNDQQLSEAQKVKNFFGWDDFN
jgi:hypothetical protein